MPQSLLLHSPLRILGTHAHTPSVSFKPPGLGREPQSTTWESSNVAITLTAGPLRVVLFCFCYRACALTRKTERDRETESEKSPPTGDGHATIPSPPFSSQELGHARTYTQREFKPPGPGRELRSTTWESSDIAVTPTAGPQMSYVLTTGSIPTLLGLAVKNLSLINVTEQPRRFPP